MTNPERERLVVFLSVLANLHRLVEHEGIEPLEKTAYVLVERWLDTIYPPATRYIDGIKGDFLPEAADAFLCGFDDDEQWHLERFNRFVELRLEMMPDDQLRRRRLPGTDVLESLVRDARNLLELITTPEEREAVLARLRIVKIDSPESVDSILGAQD